MKVAVTEYLIKKANEQWHEFDIKRTYIMHTPAGQYKDKKVYLK